MLIYFKIHFRIEILFMRTFLKNNYAFIILPLFINILFLLSFFPGLLSFDSYYQWQQLSEFNFTNWHPAYHTIIMWILTRIWYSPASIALFQIIVFNITLTYGLVSLQKSGVNKFILIAIGVFISSNIINGIMLVTIWKDILFSIFVLLLTIHIFNLIQTHGHWIKNNLNMTILGLTLSNIVLLRHNGFPVAIISYLVIFFIYKTYKKYFLRSFLVFSVFILIIKFPIYNIFKVDTTNSQSYGVTFIHPIAAHINRGTNFTIKEREFLNEIFPMTNTWPYSCYDATILFYKGVNFQPVNENPLYMGKILLKYTIKNPSITINHFLCLSSFTWKISQPDQVYLETILFDSLNLDQYSKWQIYKTATYSNSIIPQLKETISNLGNFLLKRDKHKILWRPAIYMYVFLISVAIISSKNKNYLLLTIPILSQTLVIMGTAQLEALRYQYPIYLISMIFTPALIILFVNLLKNDNYAKN